MGQVRRRVLVYHRRQDTPVLAIPCTKIRRVPGHYRHWPRRGLLDGAPRHPHPKQTRIRGVSGDVGLLDAAAIAAPITSGRMPTRYPPQVFAKPKTAAEIAREA